MTGDALRNTLDHLALDPNSGADRHYLVTMLRRLGYSEQEIRQVLGDDGEEGRVIEVEYTGKGATFLFGKPGATRTFSVVEGEEGKQQFTLTDDEGATQFTLAGDEAAGVESFEQVDLDDVDVSDDWGDWDDDGGKDVVAGLAATRIDNDDAVVAAGLAGGGTQVVEVLCVQSGPQSEPHCGAQLPRDTRAWLGRCDADDRGNLGRVVRRLDADVPDGTWIGRRVGSGVDVAGQGTKAPPTGGDGVANVPCVAAADPVLDQRVTNQ